MAATPSPQYPEWIPGVEVDHVNAARTHLLSIFPEASLNPSSPEVVYLEALAVALGPVAMAYQRAPAAVVEHLMGLYGVTRHRGIKARGKVRFHVNTAYSQVTIPAGTAVRYNLGESVGTLEYVTTETIVVQPSDSAEGVAHVIAAEVGPEYNGLPVETPLELVPYIMAVQSVEISQAPADGRGPEGNESFQEKAMATLSRQTTTLVLDESFEYAALARDEVGRAFVLNNYNPAAPDVETLGHVTVAVTDNDGHPVQDDAEADVKTDLREWLQTQSYAALSVHVIDPSYTTVDLAVTVEAAPGANLAEVQASVEDALRARLNPMSWPGWDTITDHDVTGWVDDVADVARVVETTTAVALPGPVPLPLPGVMTVTVNETTR